MDEFYDQEPKHEKIELPKLSIPKNLLRELIEFVQNALEKDEKQI